MGQLLFEWQEDRYRHQWIFGDSTWIRSVESASSEIWPASPPLQQIHRQSFGDGREVIFGVGMAGRGHWSASFTLVPELRSWIIELACRCPLEPQRLSSSYQLNTPVDPASNLKYWIDVERKISLEAIAPGTVANLQGSMIEFAPLTITSGESTNQWAFRLRVGDS